MIPPDMSGPGPDIGLGVGIGGDEPGSTIHAIPYPMGHPARIGEDGFPGPTTNTNGTTPISIPTATIRPRSSSGKLQQSPVLRSPRSLGHIRGNGSGASEATRGAGSGSSLGSSKRINIGGDNGSTTSGNLSSSINLTAGSAGSTSAVSANGGVSGSRSTLSMPIPAPPSLAALAGDASPEIVERELARLLGEFQIALGVAGDVVGEGARGRARRRRGVGESGSEWEDED